MAAMNGMFIFDEADKTEPFAIAIRSLQREIIMRDPNWQDGAYTSETWPETGLRLARKLGMISYRSGSEWRTRFGRQPQRRYSPRLFGMHFAIESYLENAARKFIRNFDPCCYLYLSRAIDLYNLGEGYPDLKSAFEGMTIESSKIIGVETDFLWPPHQQRGTGSGRGQHQGRGRHRAVAPDAPAPQPDAPRRRVAVVVLDQQRHILDTFSKRRQINAEVTTNRC